jgi:hypothetical protein
VQVVLVPVVLWPQVEQLQLITLAPLLTNATHLLQLVILWSQTVALWNTLLWEVEVEVQEEELAEVAVVQDK